MNVLYSQRLDLWLPKVGGGEKWNWMKMVKMYKLPVINEY